MGVLPVTVALLFVAAQGGAIFSTAFAAARVTGKNSLMAKAVWMILSYIGWVVFTFTLFGVMGADVFIIPMVGAITAFFSALLYLGMWIMSPTLKAKLHG